MSAPILLICSTMPAGDAVATRCNLSSWYVEPRFRAYAPMLVSQALRHKNVTYLNVSPAPHTRPIIEAQGFSRYCDGIFVAVPMLQGLFGGPKVEVFDAQRRPEVAFDPCDQEILLQHAAHGCISLWCATSERAYPFVFRPRMVRRGVPCAQLIYCRDVGDFVRFAGPIGRVLARHGKPFVIIDANGPMPGLLGWYSRGQHAEIFQGSAAPPPRRPRLYRTRGIGGLSSPAVAPLQPRPFHDRRFTRRRGRDRSLPPRWKLGDVGAVSRHFFLTRPLLLFLLFFFSRVPFLAAFLAFIAGRGAYENGLGYSPPCSPGSGGGRVEVTLFIRVNITPAVQNDFQKDVVSLSIRWYLLTHHRVGASRQVGVCYGIEQHTNNVVGGVSHRLSQDFLYGILICLT